jgi:hypothetical protein
MPIINVAEMKKSPVGLTGILTPCIAHAAI